MEKKNVYIPVILYQRAILKEVLRIIDLSFVVVNVGYIEDTFEVMLRTECKIYLCPLYRKTIPISPIKLEG
jgi:hypothetical protein